MTKDQNVSDWWQTDIIEMEPGMIRYRGYEIQDLIGQTSFSQMIWLMVRGELPSKEQSELLDVVLMSAIEISFTAVSDRICFLYFYFHFSKNKPNQTKRNITF